MPPRNTPRVRRSCRTAPWLLATLTLTLALAGPSYADSLAAEEVSEADLVLAGESAEVPMEEPQAPPEPVIELPEEPVPEPVVEPVPEPPVEEPPAAEAPAAEPVDVPVEAPADAPDEAPVTLGAAEQQYAPPPDPEGPEAVPPVDEAPAGPVGMPSAPEEPDASVDDGLQQLVVPLNLNVDIRILSPGGDGDVSQLVDFGDLPGLGSGSPTDVLGGLGLGELDLGLDWTWDWNWTWDCGDASTAGLDWSWHWTWSGDCASGIFDERDERDGFEPGELNPSSLVERLRMDRYAGMLDDDDPNFDGFVFPSMPAEQTEPVAVASPPALRNPQGRTEERREAGGVIAPSGGGGSSAGPLTLMNFIAPATAALGAPELPARRPAGSDRNGDPEPEPAETAPQAMSVATAGGAGGGGGSAFSMFLLASLVAALALIPPPPGGRIRAVRQTLSSLLSSSRLERPG